MRPLYRALGCTARRVAAKEEKEAQRTAQAAKKRKMCKNEKRAREIEDWTSSGWMADGKRKRTANPSYT